MAFNMQRSCHDHSINVYFYKSNGSWRKTFHRCLKHPLSSPDSALLRVVRNPPLQEPLAKRSLCHGSSLIHSGGFILPEKLHPSSASTRPPHSLSEAAFPRGSHLPTHRALRSTTPHPGCSQRPSHYVTNKQLSL